MEPHYTHCTLSVSWSVQTLLVLLKLNHDTWLLQLYIDHLQVIDEEVEERWHSHSLHATMIMAYTVCTSSSNIKHRIYNIQNWYMAFRYNPYIYSSFLFCACFLSKAENLKQNWNKCETKICFIAADRWRCFVSGFWCMRQNAVWCQGLELWL